MKKEIVKNIFSDQTDTNIALTSENNPPLLYKDLKALVNKISRQLSGNHISNKDRAAIILPASNSVIIPGPTTSSLNRPIKA